MLSNKVNTEINKLIAQGAITTALLNDQILKYLKPEITHNPQAPGLIFGGQTVTPLLRPPRHDRLPRPSLRSLLAMTK
jgi:hypothetical protein